MWNKIIGLHCIVIKWIRLINVNLFKEIMWRRRKKINSNGKTSRKRKQKEIYENWLPINKVEEVLIIPTYNWIYSVILLLYANFLFHSFPPSPSPHFSTHFCSSISSFMRLAAAFICCMYTIKLTYVPERWFLASDEWKKKTYLLRIEYRSKLFGKLYSESALHTNFRT